MERDQETGDTSGKVQQTHNRDSKGESGENVEMAIVKRSWFPKWKTDMSTWVKGVY